MVWAVFASSDAAWAALDSSLEEAAPPISDAVGMPASGTGAPGSVPEGGESGGAFSEGGPFPRGGDSRGGTEGGESGERLWSSGESGGRLWCSEAWRASGARLAGWHLAPREELEGAGLPRCFPPFHAVALARSLSLSLSLSFSLTVYIYMN